MKFYVQTCLILLSFNCLIFISVCDTMDYSYIKNLKNQRIDYPIRFTYINKINTWWPPKLTLAQMGVPGNFNPPVEPNLYNYVALTFWTCENGSTDITKMWDDPVKYFGTQLGSTTEAAQKYMKNAYNSKGASIILSVFGASQHPTSKGLDAIKCAQKLGNYVLQNNYDGVDIDYEDNAAMNNGTGQDWLISFTKQLRSIIPYHLISHTPQAPYFDKTSYKNGGYMRIHKEVGDLIDFYNVQYYNQQKSAYDTYDTLFINSGSASPNTSVLELVSNGIPMNMIVVGKPISKNDVYNTGYVEPTILLQYFIRAKKELNYKNGMMFWQFASDQNATVVNQFTRVMQAMSRQ